MSWKTVKLGDICKTTSGGTPKRNVSNYYNGAIPWVKSGELKDSLITETGETISKLGLDNSSTKLIPKGTLLIALYGATVGKLGVLDIEAASNQAVCAITISEKVHQKYLFHYLFKIRENLIERSSGGAQPNISQRIVRDIEIPLPPLPEQKRIAEVLDKADALREKRRLALQKLDTLLQTVFLEMFGDPRINPKKWKVFKLGELLEYGPQNGIYKPASSYGKGVRILRIDGFYDGLVTSLNNLKRLEIEDKEIKLYGLAEGDIVEASPKLLKLERWSPDGQELHIGNFNFILSVY